MSNGDQTISINEGNINYKSVSCENIPEIFLDKLIAKRHFSRFGKINRFILRPKRLSCTVEYENEADAKNAYLNAADYEGHCFYICYSTNEIAHTQNTEEWVDPEVQSELDAMQSVSRTAISKASQQRTKFQTPASPGRVSKQIIKSALKQVTPSQQTASIMSNDITEEPAALKIDMKTKNELEMLLREQAFTNEDRYHILDARDKLIRLTTARTTDIKVSTKGTCPDMCPEKERYLRESKHQISYFEMDPEKINTMNHKIAIKQYSRSSADQEAPLPHELRPEPVLIMTMTYLMHKIMNLCDDPNINIGDWFHFVWDRTRSVRKDITYQELCSLESVRLVEQCARFHIHCAARLIAEDPSAFDQKINTENLTKCLQTLKYMYNDLSLKQIKCHNEPEFRAYVILMNLNEGKFLSEFRDLPEDIRNSKEVREALSFYVAIDNRNYVRFFKLIRETTYMNACILMRYFNQVREAALRIIMKAYKSARSIPLQYFTEILAFESEDDATAFVNHYGIECEDNKIILDKNQLYEPEFPYAMERSALVEGKRGSISVGEVVNGGKLEPATIFENHVPQDSFDNMNYLKSEAWPPEIIAIKKDSKIKLTVPEDTADSGLFKVPRASPPISSKQQQQRFNNTNQSLTTLKPATFGTSSSNVFAMRPDIKTNETSSTTSLFGLSKTEEKKSPFTLTSSDFVEKSLPSENSTTNIFGGNSQKSTTAQSFETNIFGRLDKSNDNKTNSIFGSFNQQSKSAELGMFTQQYPPKSTGIFFSQSSAFSKPQSKTEEFFKPQLNEIQKQHEEKQRHTELEIEKRRQQEELERELKRKQKEEEEEKEEYRRKLEEEEKEKERERQRQMAIAVEKEKLKKIKELNEKSERVCIDILNEFCASEIEKLCMKELRIFDEKLTRKAQEFYEKLLAVIIEEDIVIAEISLFCKSREILRKYFELWRENSQKQIERRKLIETTPIWMTGDTITEQARTFAHSQLNQSLEQMKRYRLGVPKTFDLNSQHEETIDLFKLFSRQLEKRAEFNDRGLLRRKTYFKCVISLPDEPENYFDEHENSKGFYEYMNSRLKKIFLPSSHSDTFESATNDKEFLCSCQNNICICLRKVHGIHPKNEQNKQVTNECDHSNALIFLLTCSNLKNSQKRLAMLLNSSRVRILQKIPITIIVYNNQTKTQDDIRRELQLSEFDQILSYRIFEIHERENKSNMVRIFEETFKFLIDSYKRECDLEMQKLSSFLSVTIGDEFWKRVNNSLELNPLFYEFCTRPENVIHLYTETIDKLIKIIEENLDDYPEFPEELQKFVPDLSYMDIPLEVEHFPRNWKLQQSENCFRLKTFLNKIKLQNFDEQQTNLLWSMSLKEIEEFLLKFAEKCIPSNTQMAKKAGYNSVKVLLEKLRSVNLQNSDEILTRIRQISWLEIIGCIALHSLTTIWQADVNFLPNNVIYKKKMFNDFIKLSWWFKIKPLIIPSLLICPETKKRKDEQEQENQIEEQETVSQDHYLPKAKKTKNDFSSTLTDIDLNAILAIEKAQENIQKFNKYSEINRTLSRDLELKLHKLRYKK